MHTSSANINLNLYQEGCVYRLCDIAIRCGSAWTIYYEDRVFDSIIAFCEAYGCRVSTTQKKFVRGIPPSQVIKDSQLYKRRERKPIQHKRQYPCTYGNESYSSLSEAASALGIPLYWLYSFKKKHNYSAQTALELAVDEYPKAKRETGHKNGRCLPCKVDGTTYPSRAAACKAYDMPAITVYSRMEREGISFEEALARGNKDRKHIIPVPVKFNKLHLIKHDITELSPTLSIVSLYNILQRYKYLPEYYKAATGELVLKIVETFSSAQMPYNMYIVFPPADTKGSVPVEIVVPRLVTYQSDEIPYNTSFFQHLNELNLEYINLKLVYDPPSRTVSAIWAQTIKQSHGQVADMLQAIFFLLGTCDRVVQFFQDSSGSV